MRSGEEKQELYSKLKETIGEPVYSGETIDFYFKGNKVGSGPLPQWTGTLARHIIADIAGVSEYDDFHFVKNDGSIRAKGSDIKRNGLSATSEDMVGDLGTIEGIKYQFYRNVNPCPHCGQNQYKAKFPEQKELIDKLYGRV